jgi:alanine racemase
VTIASPTSRGAWRTAATSIWSPPARVCTAETHPESHRVVELAAWTHVAVTLGSGRAAEATLAAAAGAATTGAPPLVVHVEVETGLGRGGVVPADLEATVAAARGAPGVTLAGLWTHLAAPDDAASARAQDVRFDDAVAGITDRAAVDGIVRHVSASGGVLGATAGTWDAIRPGLATYGLVPDGLVVDGDAARAAAAMRPVMSLHARPIRVLDLPAGHGVSYGATFVTGRPSRIATIPVGYGDGWRRTWSGNAMAIVRGVRVPLVGRVAMDAVMADVTDVPGTPVTEDDEVVLIGTQDGERITAFDLAAAGGTISYEVVTGMSRRLPRVYHAAGSPVEIRYLAGGRSEWRASSSGTGTSAISRSTPS